MLNHGEGYKKLDSDSDRNSANENFISSVSLSLFFIRS